MEKSIGYHARLIDGSDQKVVGGIFGGSLDMDTVRRLVKVHFSAKVLDSGTVVFVDRKGNPVSLYLKVDPRNTEIGAAALQAWRIEAAKKAAELEIIEAKQAEEIEAACAGLSHEEILRLLNAPRS